MWLDAADPETIRPGATTGSNVGAWRDKGPRDNIMFQNTVISQPTYTTIPSTSLRAVYFATNTRRLTSLSNNQMSGSTSRTIFAVTHLPDTSSRAIIGTGATTANNAFGFDQSPAVNVLWVPYYYNDNDNTISVALTGTNCLYAQHDATTLQTIGGYGFGSSYVQKAVTATATTASPWYFGQRAGDLEGSTNAYICEFLLYNGVLSLAQRQQVEGYLAWKWGIQAQLPANHPYVAGPP